MIDILKDEMEDEIRETAMMRTVAELVLHQESIKGKVWRSHVLFPSCRRGYVD